MGNGEQKKTSTWRIGSQLVNKYLGSPPMYKPGQIITTSAEVTLNGGLVGESTKNPLNSGLGIILICPE